MLPSVNNRVSREFPREGKRESMSEQGTPAARSAQECTASSGGSGSRSILNPDVGDHKRSKKPRRMRKGARPFPMISYDENWGMPDGAGAPPK